MTVAYPGIWLRDDVYATHGHYLDRHTTVPLIERIGAGVMARILRESPQGPRSIEDYERTLQPLYAWIHSLAQAGAHDIGDSRLDPSMRGWRVLTGANGRRTLRERGVAAAFPAAVAAMNKARIGPLEPDLSGPQLRRAALAAFAEVVDRLHIDAPPHHLRPHPSRRSAPVRRSARSGGRAPGRRSSTAEAGWISPTSSGPTRRPAPTGPDSGSR